jgi:hypothetical protein
MSAEVSPELFRRYEAALEAISQQIQDQIALEDYQSSCGRNWNDICLGRADTYLRIGKITGDAIGRDFKLSNY